PWRHSWLLIQTLGPVDPALRYGVVVAPYSTLLSSRLGPEPTPAMLPVTDICQGKRSRGSTQESTKFRGFGLFSWDSCIPFTGRDILLRVKCARCARTKTCFWRASIAGICGLRARSAREIAPVLLEQLGACLVEQERKESVAAAAGDLRDG